MCSRSSRSVKICKQVGAEAGRGGALTICSPCHAARSVAICESRLKIQASGHRDAEQDMRGETLSLTTWVSHDLCSGEPLTTTHAGSIVILRRENLRQATAPSSIFHHSRIPATPALFPEHSCTSPPPHRHASALPRAPEDPPATPRLRARMPRAATAAAWACRPTCCMPTRTLLLRGGRARCHRDTASPHPFSLNPHRAHKPPCATYMFYIGYRYNSHEQPA